MSYDGNPYGWNSDLEGYGKCNPCGPCAKPRPPPRCPRPKFDCELFSCLTTDRVTTTVIFNNTPCTCPMGHAKFRMNSCCDKINYCGLFINLTSDVTAVTINRAAVAAVGPVVKTLTAFEHVVPSNPWLGGCCKVFWSVCGVWSRCDETQPLTGMLADHFGVGDLYILVSTVNNPAGEIRGQIFQYAEIRKYQDCDTCVTPYPGH